MEETSEELPKLSIGIDLLRSDPTSSKNKAEYKTNYTRRHEFITHKNNCCQVFSSSRNEQPLFVNECKVG